MLAQYYYQVSVYWFWLFLFFYFAGATPHLANIILGQNALHMSCWKGNRNIVQRLLAMGIAVNTPDCFKKTALHYALIQGKFRIVDLLLQHDADGNVTDDFGVTPLHLCCYHGKIELIAKFVEMGCDINAIDKSGCSAFWYALRHDIQHEPTSTVCNELLQHNARFSGGGRGLEFSNIYRVWEDYTDGSLDDESLMFCEVQIREIFEMVLMLTNQAAVKAFIILGCPYPPNSDLLEFTDFGIEQWVTDFRKTPQLLSNLCRIVLRTKVFPSGREFGAALEACSHFIPPAVESFIRAEDILT